MGRGCHKEAGDIDGATDGFRVVGAGGITGGVGLLIMDGGVIGGLIEGDTTGESP